MKSANFWIRAIAYLVDILFIGVILKFTVGYFFSIIDFYPTLIPENEIMHLLESNSFTLSKIININSLVIYSVTINFLRILYFSIFEASALQATPFKKLFKIKVVDMDGNRISFIRSFSRNLCKIISGLILCAGFIMALFTKKGQALHDMCANCRVVESEK